MTYGNVMEVDAVVEDASVTAYGDEFVVQLVSHTDGAFVDDRGYRSYWDSASEPVTYLLTGGRLVRVEGDLPFERLSTGPTVACV